MKDPRLAPARIDQPHVTGSSNRSISYQSAYGELPWLASRWGSTTAYLPAVVYAGLGELDPAFEWLEEAHPLRDSAWLIYYLIADP